MKSKPIKTWKIQKDGSLEIYLGYMTWISISETKSILVYKVVVGHRFVGHVDTLQDAKKLALKHVKILYKNIDKFDYLGGD